MAFKTTVLPCFTDNNKADQLLQQHGVIRVTCLCMGCGNETTPDTITQSLCWTCRYSYSSRYQTALEKLSLESSQIVAILWGLCGTPEYSAIARFAECHETIPSKCAASLAPILEDWMDVNGLNIIANNGRDGVRIFTEIDETALGHRKYNRGGPRRAIDIFGMKCRRTGLTIPRVVRDRTQESIWPLISKHISQDVTVISDGHQTYHSLDRIGYDNLWVNHTVAYSFEMEGVRVHTNSIEGAWHSLKQSLKTARDPDVGCLWFQFRSSERGDGRHLKLFFKLLNVLRDQRPDQ